MQVLDIDASGGCSVECAQAIRSSMNKLKAQDDIDTHLLAGQTTDSGGGGVLDNLAKKLHAIDHLCVPLKDYLVANCTIHALQLQISNAIRTTFGEGGLEKVNAMQLLHSVYRLQELLSDLNEWRHILHRAGQCVSSYDDTEVIVLPKRSTAQQRNQDAFRQEFLKTYKFHSKFKKNALPDPSSAATTYKMTTCMKMLAPILPRWWTVGAGASYAFDYYLYIYHVCQQVINTYDSVTAPYKIALSLFALMSNQENFLDMMLIRSFHKACVNPHMDWFQSADDLSGEQAFQSHNILGRFCIMKCDIRDLESRRSFPECREAVNKCCPPDTHKHQNKKHLDKLIVFVTAAHASLCKHFIRWVSHKMLPAALMSEGPLAKVVAAAMLNEPMPEFPSLYNPLSGFAYFESTADGRKIELGAFNKFLRQQMSLVSAEDEDGMLHCTPQALRAARSVLDGIDLCSMNHDGDIGQFRCCMHVAHLSLPSQTSFVKRGVKDAKEVSLTDAVDLSNTGHAWLQSDLLPLSESLKKTKS